MKKQLFYFQSSINSIQKPSQGSGSSILVSSLNKNWEREWIDFFKSGFSRLEFLKTKFSSPSKSTSSTQWLTASSCESLWMSQVSMWPSFIASWRFPEYVPELELTIYKNSLPWFRKNHDDVCEFCKNLKKSISSEDKSGWWNDIRIGLVFQGSMFRSEVTELIK